MKFFMTKTATQFIPLVSSPSILKQKAFRPNGSGDKSIISLNNISTSSQNICRKRFLLKIISWDLSRQSKKFIIPEHWKQQKKPMNGWLLTNYFSCNLQAKKDDTNGR